MSGLTAARNKLRGIQKGLCCYCDKPMVRRKAAGCPKGGWPHDTETLEHLRRKFEGGTDRCDNLALACAECNVGRGDMDWFTYKTYKQGELNY